jgi:hypothetical protein
MSNSGTAILSDLANACEQLNNFARMLENTGRFKSVLAFTDLRSYLTGWAFEKYIEALLPGDNALTAVWMLELAQAEGGLQLTANTSISHAQYDEDLSIELVHGVEIREALSHAVDALVGSYNNGESFREEIVRNPRTPIIHGHPLIKIIVRNRCRKIELNKKFH